MGNFHKVSDVLYRGEQPTKAGIKTLDEMTKGAYCYHSIWKNLVDYIKELDIEKIKRNASIKR